MQRTRIKICGISRVEDALAAAGCGADAIGMIFYPSARRHINAERARQIIAALPAFVTPVGVFVNTPSREILDAAENLRLRHIQLNGNETPEQVSELRGLTVIKAIKVDPKSFASGLDQWRDRIKAGALSNLQGILLETANTGQPGGTGMENDWEAIRTHQQAGAFDNLPPIIAAGGLTPANVREVVRTLRPWAVDVSSGVESTFGSKSEEKIKAFVAAVRDGDASV